MIGFNFHRRRVSSGLLRSVRFTLLLFIGVLWAFPAAAREGNPSLAVESVPLKVFILAGQSNMQGHAHVRTIPSMKLDPRLVPLHDALVGDDGTPVTCERVWISSIGCAPEEQVGKLSAGFGAGDRGEKIGPEFSFGVTVARLLDEPVLLIKTSWGGKSLHTDFRPPSAGRYEFNESELEGFRKRGVDPENARAEKDAATGVNYRLMIEHVRTVLADIPRIVPGHDPKQGYELAGFIWFQGWNDMVDGNAYPNRDKPGGYGAYSEVFAHFIRDVRRDLDAAALPFVIGVLGVGGPVEEYGPEQQRYVATHRNFRDAMAAPAAMDEFKGTVAAVRTEAFWDREVSALKEREETLKPELERIRAEVKQGAQARAQGDAAIESIYASRFNERELTLLRDSVSNQEYHYLGSARILAPIGEAFAESAVVLLKKRADTGASKGVSR
ncbi:MAG: sialate O-acetylesterase [Planctomycetaceae bacterium]|nr:sialate O-acetylesterase [Planctomycetaceae bacterium]